MVIDVADPENPTVGGPDYGLPSFDALDGAIDVVTLGLGAGATNDNTTTTPWSQP